MDDNDHVIGKLYNDISYLNNQLHQNTEKLVRLKHAHKNIEIKQEDFFHNKRFIDEPQLSSVVWDGRHANDFLEFRNYIEEAYVRIGNQDIENMLENIEDKISYYEGINQTLANSISSKRERIAQLRNVEK
ncbi:DUF5082 family protein [Bacillus sp. CECT 9360]|uniref:YwqH-like family protein n=1 Tax=Bacillus sp. CECT 9360 TaxID=2845821 RepID=UPI001E2BAB04|nr:DUF5082 family protein [Bacillus sp. CECT 9360]CAH0345446.1 hypothetical protein BCI9360_01732 [Bacillus sp. CECT 9360]